MKKADKLQVLILLEWDNLHHNARINKWPEFRNEYENSLFWDILGDEISLWIEDLTNDIADKFGKTLKFYSYGRMGATIAPAEWMNPAPCNNFGSCSYQVGETLEELEEAKKVLKILKYINSYWRNTADYIPKWWKETKEANEYDKTIAEYDNKKPYNTIVWR